MGAPMARNLAAAASGCGRGIGTRSKAEALSDVAAVASSPAEAARDANIVLTTLADGDSVAATMEGEDGALEAMGPPPCGSRRAPWGSKPRSGSRSAPPSAASASSTRPLLGTKQPAEEGGLVVLASGPEDVRERCEPVFEAIGQRTLWLGAAGSGIRLKLVLNTWLLALVEGLGEAIALTEALELDSRRFLEAIEGGPLGPAYAQLKGEPMIERSFPPRFPLRLAHKDARLALEAAARTGARLAALEATAAQLERAIDEGHAEEDMAAAVYASLAGA